MKRKRIRNADDAKTIKPLATPGNASLQEKQVEKETDNKNTDYLDRPHMLFR